ncbi:MAG: exodeoxyribonuclease VII large subunit [Alistipes sp.]|nr:exodeoxyribonuclease VII large subunit [Candidatus Alistipes equi]
MEKKYYTLSNLLGYLRLAVQNTFPDNYWVCAEISKIGSNSSGHYYVELVERDQNGGVGAPKAQIKGTIWRNRASLIIGNFLKVTGRSLENGIKILAQVQVSFSEVYGVSLNILDIDPTYTLGDIARQREETIAKLHEIGIWDKNREIPLPTVPQNIAVVSSPTAAGYQDFMNEIEHSPFDIRVTLFEALMQGQGAEQSILSALSSIRQSNGTFDLAVIIRGGGSTTDLGCFDSFELSKEVATYPLPVLTGIGHERDQSIVDMVAGIRMKTPTAAAQWIVGKCNEMLQRITDISSALRKNVEHLQTTVEMQIRNISQKLCASTSLMFQKAKSKVTESRIKLGHNAEKFYINQMHAIEQRKKELESRARNTIAKAQSELKTKQALTETYSLEHVFKMGYALAQKQGRAIRHVGEVQLDDIITIHVIDGEIDSRIVEIKKKIRTNG